MRFNPFRRTKIHLTEEKYSTNAPDKSQEEGIRATKKLSTPTGQETAVTLPKRLSPEEEKIASAVSKFFANTMSIHTLEAHLGELKQRFVYIASMPNTNFEKDNMSHSIEALQEFVDCAIDQDEFDNEILQNAKEQLSNIKSFAEMSEAASLGSKSAERRCFTHFRSQINGLVDGKSLLFPGGTKEHSILYEVKFTGEKYQFTILNTGEGIKHHDSLANTGKYNPSYSMGNISLRHLDDSFLKELLDCKSDDSVNNIYRCVKKLSKKEKKTAPIDP
ncbi:MAG: hypothetical protein ACI9S8_001847 [Chlamydiales bacterium]|jgi:hypothetical protein